VKTVLKQSGACRAARVFTVVYRGREYSIGKLELK